MGNPAPALVALRVPGTAPDLSYRVRGPARGTTQDSKTRLLEQLATAELPNRTNLLPQKAATKHVDRRYAQLIINSTPGSAFAPLALRSDSVELPLAVGPGHLP